MKELRVAREGLEIPYKLLNSTLGAVCFGGSIFCLRLAEALSPTRVSELETSASDIFRYILIGVGLLLIPITILCYVRTRVLVRRKEKDLLQIGISHKVLARRDELRQVVFSENGGLARMSVRRHERPELVLVESRDRVMVETAAREVARILDLPLEGVAPVSPDQRPEGGAASDIPFYLRDAAGGSADATGLRLQRAPGLLRIEAQSPAKSQPGLLATLMLCASLPAILYTVVVYAQLANAGKWFPIFDIHFMVASGLTLYLLVGGLRRALAPTVWRLTVTAHALEVRGPGTHEILPLDEIVEMRVSAEETDVAVGFDSHYLGFRTSSCWLLVPRLREGVALALDAQIRSALRELRGAAAAS